LQDPRKWSKEFLSFLSACLQKDSKTRPSAITLLQHPFITASRGSMALQPLIDEVIKKKKKKTSKFYNSLKTARSISKSVDEGFTGTGTTGTGMGTIPEDSGDGNYSTMIVNDGEEKTVFVNLKHSLAQKNFIKKGQKQSAVSGQRGLVQRTLGPLPRALGLLALLLLNHPRHVFCAMRKRKRISRNQSYPIKVKCRTNRFRTPTHSKIHFQIRINPNQLFLILCRSFRISWDWSRSRFCCAGLDFEQPPSLEPSSLLVNMM